MSLTADNRRLVAGGTSSQVPRRAVNELPSSNIVSVHSAPRLDDKNLGLDKLLVHLPSTNSQQQHSPPATASLFAGLSSIVPFTPNSGSSEMSNRLPFFPGRENRVTTVIATPGYGPDRQVEVSYTEMKVIGNGSFGVVYSAKLVEQNEMIAIKKVLQDKRFKNRELQIMRKLEHQNVVKLKYFFYSSGEKKDELYLNLIMDFIPENVYRVVRVYSKQRQTIPILYVKLYMYQLMRALGYIHALGICHRDIKPQNLLLDPETAVLKLCDFGSAKHLVRGEPNVSYICSRYYRAPELIFGATDYQTNIDVWSAGCVLAELLLGQPIFPGDSGVDQLVEIIKVLGTPTRDQIQQMNPNYTEFRFPQIRAHPWNRVFRPRTPADAIELVSRLLEYTPAGRLHPLQACAHQFFNELRTPGCKLPSGKALPPLFNFTDQELLAAPQLAATLIPPHAVGEAGPSAAAAIEKAAGSSGDFQQQSSSGAVGDGLSSTAPQQTVPTETGEADEGGSGEAGASQTHDPTKPSPPAVTSPGQQQQQQAITANST